MSHDFARSQRIRKESGHRPSRRKKSSGIPSWLWLLVGTLAGCLIMFLVYLSGVRPPLPAPASVVAPHTATPTTDSSVTTEQPPAPPKRVSPVFEFYTKLPEGGQPVTDIAPVPQPDSTTTPTPPPVLQPSTTENLSADAATVPPPVSEPDVKEQEEEMDPIQQLLAQKEKERKEKVQKEKQQTTAFSKPVTTPTPQAAAGGTRYLQAGVFRNKAEAEKLRSRISGLGIGTSMRSVSGASGDTLQKVLAGPFRSGEEADKARAILGGNGINTIPAR